jgi:flavin-dependent dehydrogenase
MNHEPRNGLGALQDGQTVAIIGGGPGGAACAIALKNMAAEAGIEIDVILYEGKVFRGETHYNQCVGVLSPPIEQILHEELGVPFPYQLVQGQITSYVLHSDRQVIELCDDREPSYTLRRVHFDAYLLEQAQVRGVRVLHSRVTDVELRGDRVGIYSESKQCQADVVVGAFGLDDGGCKLFERATAHTGRNRYRQPQALSSIVTKIHAQEPFLSKFGDRIHAYLPAIPQIEFGAITPKRDHLTVNIAGATVTSLWMDRFLELPAVRQILPRDGNARLKPEGNGFASFKGRFPISVAGNFYGDRYVIVGDAAGLVRSFKGKGVNSALISGLAAAKAMIGDGISKEAFRRSYITDPHLQAILDDLAYGRVVRRLVIAGAKYGLLDGVLALARGEPSLRRALLNSVAAHKPYKEIMRETLQPALALRLLGTIGLSGLGLNARPWFSSGHHPVKS